MAKCSFCGNAIEQGTGKMLVRKDGAISFFCSSKCEKNTAMKRESKYVRWTATAAKAKGK